MCFFKNVARTLYRAIAISRYKKCRATGCTAAHAELPTPWKGELWS